MVKAKKSSENRNLDYYRKAFVELNVYRSKRLALNQPILLFSLIDLISKKSINCNHIEISDELIECFNEYWKLITNRKIISHTFALPFFHLKMNKYKFWHIQFTDEYEGGRPQTTPTLRRDVAYGYFDTELFELLQDTNSRQDLIDTLVASWFSQSQQSIEEITIIHQRFQNKDLENAEKKLKTSKSQKTYQKISPLRDALFRKTITQIYNQKCAFCGLKIQNLWNHSLVEGAHIKPFAEFRDNQINNGISLCRNHHWAFDRGLFCLDNQYKIVVSEDFEEESPHNKPIKDFQGEKILLPFLEKYFPSLESLEWHRKHKFKG